MNLSWNVKESIPPAGRFRSGGGGGSGTNEPLFTIDYKVKGSVLNGGLNSTRQPLARGVPRKNKRRNGFSVMNATQGSVKRSVLIASTRVAKPKIEPEKQNDFYWNIITVGTDPFTGVFVAQAILFQTLPQIANAACGSLRVPAKSRRVSQEVGTR